MKFGTKTFDGYKNYPKTTPRPLEKLLPISHVLSQNSSDISKIAFFVELRIETLADKSCEV